MDIYVGARNVTPQFNSFFTQDGVTLDGNFNGNTETQAYTQALTYLRNILKSAVPSEGVGGQSRAEVRAAIDARFEAYIDMIKSEGCEGRFEAIPVLQGLYEELTAFIESEAFEDIPAAKQNLIVGLQAEVFSRLEQRGTHRGVLPQDEEGTGTYAELAAFNPVSEDFAAHPEVLENVTEAAPMITWDNPTCPVNAGDVSAEGSLNIYGSEGSKPQPFTGSAVNMDFRYDLHQRPVSTTPAPAAGQKAAPEGEKLDLVDLTDPLAGI